MKVHKGVSNREQILEGMKLVYEKLVEEKKRTDSPIVVMRDGKIAYVKPWLEESEGKTANVED